jgi:hypothetical protein
MFGDDEDQNDQQAVNNDDNQQPNVIEPTSSAPADTSVDDSPSSLTDTSADSPAEQAPVAVTPADDTVAGTDPVITSTSSPATNDMAPATPIPGSDDLMQIKQQALQQLSPLIGKLDQTPEEKFRTTMMMIQASDNQVLIKDAYEAAQGIADEKSKAQALLDIINEINYFTQGKES